eukprot:Sro1222_g253790.2  (516) ;mRNA; f:11347-12894
MDWWPGNKCDYGVCPWKNGSILTTDLSHPRLQNLLRAIPRVTLRIGGTQADTVVYQDDDSSSSTPCLPFEPSETPSPHFQHGCLTRSKWRDIAAFANQTGANIIFGISALAGRQSSSSAAAVPAWDSSNAEAFLRFLKQDHRLYQSIVGFEFGNELNYVPNRTITPQEQARGFQALHELLQRVFPQKSFQLYGPDLGGWSDTFIRDFLAALGSSNHTSHSILTGITWHSYPLGPGYNNPHLMNTILNPKVLDSFGKKEAAALFNHTHNAKQKLVMGETGGAYNSGHDTVNNRFVDSFWYLQAMGVLAQHRHDMFCRQALVGGNYELINTKPHGSDNNMYYPNPSYFAAYLFAQIMGAQARHVTTLGRMEEHHANANNSGMEDSSSRVRVYAHCHVNHRRLGLLLLNYDNRTTIDFVLKGYDNDNNSDLIPRDEYHITATHIQADQVQCNGETVIVDEQGTFHLHPRTIIHVDSGIIIKVLPQSYAFVVFAKESVVSQRECGGATTTTSNGMASTV